MKNYFTDPNAMSLPWCESPFFHELLPLKLTEYKTQFNVSDDFLDILRNKAIDFYESGYAVIDLGLTDEFINTLVREVDEKIMEGAVKTQEGHFHYNNGPRVFEAWKWNQHVLDLARHPVAMNFIEFLYGRTAMPFQTINFKLGSSQPIHSDACHFNTQPERWVCGFWTALEDITENNGPLVVYPGSHKEPITEFQELNMEKTAYKEEKDNYTEYENFVRQLIEAKGYQKTPFIAPKGSALVWAANLLHGGSEILDPSTTRFSQATHCYMEGCEHYYTPFYSNRFAGEYSDKDVTSKNIRDYEITNV